MPVTARTSARCTPTPTAPCTASTNASWSENKQRRQSEPAAHLWSGNPHVFDDEWDTNGTRRWRRMA